MATWPGTSAQYLATAEEVLRRFWWQTDIDPTGRRVGTEEVAAAVGEEWLMPRDSYRQILCVLGWHSVSFYDDQLPVLLEALRIAGDRADRQRQPADAYPDEEEKEE